jgi:hypothetical protein
MEALADVIFRSFTRYFVPGLLSYAFLVVVPVYVLVGKAKLEELGAISGSVVIVVAAISGYLLDSIGAYAWHLHWRPYKLEKRLLAERLGAMGSDGACSETDPDQHISQLWLHDEKLYERIFVERAEWVAILESALVLLLSSVCIGVGACRKGGEVLSVGLPLSAILFGLSFLASSKGMQRMRAHDSKLIEAIRSVRSQVSHPAVGGALDAGRSGGSAPS